MNKRTPLTEPPLKAYRRFFRLTQGEAAKRAGMLQSTWYRIEMGEVVPTPSNAKKLMRLTRLPMWILLTGYVTEQHSHVLAKKRKAA